MDETALTSLMAVTEDKETLWLAASEQYIRGEISAEALKNLENQQSLDPSKDTQRLSVLDFLKDVLTPPYH